MNPRRTITALAATGLALSLTACGPLDEPTLGDTSTANVEESTAEDTNDGVGEFGQAVSWDDVDIVVSPPKPFEPSQYAAGAEEFPDTVSMQIKLTNTGDEPFNPILVTVTASSGEAEASPVFDAEKGIDTPPTTAVRPGKSVKWSVVFNVADADDVLVQVTPDPGTTPVLLSTTD